MRVARDGTKTKSPPPPRQALQCSNIRQFPAEESNPCNQQERDGPAGANEESAAVGAHAIGGNQYVSSHFGHELQNVHPPATVRTLGVAV
eukprot:4397200-Prymnesium_polylepis.2